MTPSQLSTRLRDLFVGHLGLSPTALTDEASFTKDLGLDSLDVTDLLLQVEINFGIRISDQDWWKLQTVGQLKTYLTEETLQVQSGRGQTAELTD